MKRDVNHKGLLEQPLRNAKPQLSPLRAAPLAAALFAVVALGCGDAATGPDPDPNPTPTVQIGGVSVESDINLTMAVGRSTQLSATVTDTDGETVTGANPTWQSSNTDVAEVTGSGLVTAAGAGQARISATYEGVSGDIPVTVIDADLDGIARLGNDPLLLLLVNELDTELAQQISDALENLDGAITLGDCIEVRDALQNALDDITESTDSGDIVALAALNLALERAQDLLGMN